MKFEDALVLLRGGGKVRRSLWPAGVYIHLVKLPRGDHAFEMRHGLAIVSPWVVNHADLLKEDWERV